MKGAPHKRQSTSVSPPNWARKPLFWFLAVLASAIIIGFFLYAPALRGPFLFDDAGLPFAKSSLKDGPVSGWISGVRPVLMFSYWMNRTLWGDSPFSFHIINVLIHVLNAALVFLVLRRLLVLAGWTEQRVPWVPAAGALLFLIHPLQTESVSYIAGRSESLAALFMLLSYVVLLYRRRESISWIESILVLVLFAIAVKTKENAVSLAGIIVLTDIFWPKPFATRGFRNNWRLYALLIPGAAAASVAVLRTLTAAGNAGFSVDGVAWYQYGFTQARAIFLYIRMALFPVGLSIDHDYSVSRTILDHGAIFWIVLLAGLLIACLHWRRKYPLATFGFLFFLVALSPTSSIVPIADPLVERRMYLPLLGLILVGCELSRRVKLSLPVTWSAGALAVTLLGGWCYERNQQYGHPETLFAEAAAQSTRKARPYEHLAHTLYEQGRCAEEIPYLERAARLFPNNSGIQTEWGGALQCLGRLEEAAQKLQFATQLDPGSDAWEFLGLIYGALNKRDEAGAALRKAVELRPDSASAHRSLAIWYELGGDYTEAEQEYSRSLALDGQNRQASLGLIRTRQLAGQLPSR